MYKKEILDNGLRIITESIPHVRSITCGIWIGCGVVFEDSSNSGITHFTEHMLFKGTKQRSAKGIADTIEQVGGALNAITSKEYICVYAKVLSSHLNVALSLLSDMVINSTFKAEDIEKEKKIVLEEIKMYEDSPDEVIFDLFSQTILSSNKLGGRILGKEDVILNLNRDKILSFANNFFTPENTIITCAGHLQHNEIVKIISSFFCKIYKKYTMKDEERIKFAPKVLVKNRDCEQVHLCLGTKGFPRGHKDEYSLLVLDVLLGGGMSSRLFQKIREEKALAYAIYSFQNQYRSGGIFGVYAGTSEENIERVIKLILKEFKNICEKDIGFKELNRVKEHLKGNIMLSLESTTNRMGKLGRVEFYLRREVTLDEILNKIERVTKDDVKTVANKLIQEKYFTLTILGKIDENKSDGFKRLLQMN